MNWHPAEEALNQGLAIAEGVAMDKGSGQPAAEHLPPDLSGRASAMAMAEEFKLSCEVLDRADMEKLGMHSLLAVAHGSHQPPEADCSQLQG